jgi:adenylylsulfate reductase subunit A
MAIKRESYEADLLIVGGGTSGCLAAWEAKQIDPKTEVVIMEKANIQTSGCLMFCQNAINTRINNNVPEDFVRYVRFDHGYPIDEEHSLKIAKEINETIELVESWGLPIKKKPDGSYWTRGPWGLSIYGFKLKPVIAEAAKKSGATILNRVCATEFLMKDGRVVGAVGGGNREEKLVVVRAKATIICAGGCSGVFRPNNPKEAHHRLWYPAFNCGASYAMGMRIGAEMTTFEEKHIPLRIKDAIAPVGTLILGFGAGQLNAKGEKFMEKHYMHIGGNAAPTYLRLFGAIEEIKAGRGPVFLDTTVVDPSRLKDIYLAYVDMAPQILLIWAAMGANPTKVPSEICGVDPYFLGGHAAAPGYWCDINDATTIPGLWCAGDAQGATPSKYISGCWVQGRQAARSAMAGRAAANVSEADVKAQADAAEEHWMAPLKRFREGYQGVTTQQFEGRIQKIMDDNAGGRVTNYEVSEPGLKMALFNIKQMYDQYKHVVTPDPHGQMLAQDCWDRIFVAHAHIEHMLARQETRWPSFQVRLDFPKKDDANFNCFINSVMNPKTREFKMMKREYKRILPDGPGDPAWARGAGKKAAAFVEGT